MARAAITSSSRLPPSSPQARSIGASSSCAKPSKKPPDPCNSDCHPERSRGIWVCVFRTQATELLPHLRLHRELLLQRRLIGIHVQHPSKHLRDEFPARSFACL